MAKARLPGKKRAKVPKLNLKASANKKKEDDAKAEILLYAASQGWPVPEFEYRFHPVRKWRFDVVFADAKVAVEIEGLVRGGRGRHQTVAGVSGDIEKYNEAAIAGWVVVRTSYAQIKSGQFWDWLDRAVQFRLSVSP